MSIFAALMTTVVTGVWSDAAAWVKEQVSGPPELKVHADDFMGCNDRYRSASLAELKNRAKTAAQEGVIIPSAANPPSVSATVQAKTSKAIVVTDAKVTVLSRRPLPTEGAVVKVTGCGGGLYPRPFEMDLTGSGTVEPDKSGRGRAEDFPFTVSSDDPEQFTFNVKHVRGDVRFAIVLTWVSDGESGTTRLDDGGNGYRTMSRPDDLPQYRQVDLLGAD
ncbi:hypothetical protein ACFYMO_08795 [Streptomyces sp. NPDC007025]|uniref:hypothetical protein n=1 Tax=Streptomyces sp. NPDC007025 TaxID=3364771 RepID=UPI00368BCB40